MKGTILITGATSGIGKACAIELSRYYKKLIISGRRSEKLSQLASELKKNGDIEVVEACFDLSKKQECHLFAQQYSQHLEGLQALINNAGLACGVDPIDQAALDDWDRMIDTNVKGLFYMTHLCLPFLKSNPGSHIVNVSSVSGRWVYPGGGVYCSTKHAVSAFSEGLRLDLNGQGVRVTNICPGLVETEFSEVRLQDKTRAKKVYEGMTPLTPQDIAQSIRWSLQQPQHVNIQEMVIFPTDQASVHLVHRK